ncbi:hypothetical protein [Streptomyces inhibens]|uniref:hypothetical protein n=1 Tax=Streptomyces inhibens TaxID=2293571 RepID=UPI001FD42CE3|nr:hypothetical protein [Streptomyces inhibens]
MVHAEALTGPGGVVLDNAAPLEPFAEWVRAGKAGGAAMWRQPHDDHRHAAARLERRLWQLSANSCTPDLA